MVIIVSIVLIVAIGVLVAWLMTRDPDAYIYVPDGFPMAQFRYQDLPMRECAFCSSEVNLNRHHVVPQLASPERRDDPSNLIVLCRHCHQVVGHKNNWKKFNPYVGEICEKYGGPPVDSREWRERKMKEDMEHAYIESGKQEVKG